MSTASLPLPVGARAAGPSSRSVAQAWAAPRAADLVLDAWAAPVGPPIAQLLLSPWPAPDPMLRIISMPPPIVLAPVPDLSAQRAALAESTQAALAAIASSDQRPTPAALPAPTLATAAPTHSATTDSSVDGATTSTTRLRARMWAMIAGGAAAAAGVVTLVLTAF